MADRSSGAAILAALFGHSRRHHSNTAAGTRIPLGDLNDHKPSLHITDISFCGHIAGQWQIDLSLDQGHNVEQDLGDIPELLNGHARIYDSVAGQLIKPLDNHLRSLFPSIPSDQPLWAQSLVGLKEGTKPRGTVASQWTRTSSSATQWNPLYVPCTNFPVYKQYDDLYLGPCFALFSCHSVSEEKLLGDDNPN